MLHQEKELSNDPRSPLSWDKFYKLKNKVAIDKRPCSAFSVLHLTILKIVIFKNDYKFLISVHDI